MSKHNPASSSSSNANGTSGAGNKVLSEKTETEDGAEEPDCPVCLQTCIHPVKLPCSHVFCFLCVKGAASRSKRCALCRQDIPPEFFCRPNLIRKGDLQQTTVFDNEYQWYYEGQNGWWQYDDRTSIDIENHFKKGVKVFELLIAGHVYLIDLDKMVQSQRNDRTKKRRVKRDVVNLPGKKGVAGLKFNSNGNSSAARQDCDSDRPGADGDETATPTTHQIMVPIPINPLEHSGGYTNSLSPPTPYNTPQTPQTPAESPPNVSVPSERDLTIQLERLRLGDPSRLARSPIDSPRGASSTSAGSSVDTSADEAPDVAMRQRPRGHSETCPESDSEDEVDDPPQESESEIYTEIQQQMELSQAPDVSMATQSATPREDSEARSQPNESSRLDSGQDEQDSGRPVRNRPQTRSATAASNHGNQDGNDSARPTRTRQGGNARKK